MMLRIITLTACVVVHGHVVAGDDCSDDSSSLHSDHSTFNHESRYPSGSTSSAMPKEIIYLGPLLYAVPSAVPKQPTPGVYHAQGKTYYIDVTLRAFELVKSGKKTQVPVLPPTRNSETTCYVDPTTRAIFICNDYGSHCEGYLDKQVILSISNHKPHSAFGDFAAKNLPPLLIGLAAHEATGCMEKNGYSKSTSVLATLAAENFATTAVHVCQNFKNAEADHYANDWVNVDKNVLAQQLLIANASFILPKVVAATPKIVSSVVAYFRSMKKGQSTSTSAKTK